MGDIIHYEKNTNPGIYYRLVSHDTETITLESPFGERHEVTWADAKDNYIKTTIVIYHKIIDKMIV